MILDNGLLWGGGIRDGGVVGGNDCARSRRGELHLDSTVNDTKAV